MSDSDNRKDKPLVVRLDATERARLEQIAAGWGTTLAGAVRRLIREAEVKR